MRTLTTLSWLAFNIMMNQVGVVIIGRNEGQRLIRCFDSVKDKVKNIIYVDSGSTDGSVEAILKLGGIVVELDMTIPFTAARARNEGLSRLCELDPDIAFVQFIDGDCEMESGWLESSLQHISRHDDIAVVAGRLRERFPDRSIYNLLCDIEWDTDIGETDACGGIALMRVRAFQQVGGFRDALIAGEEPELCLRLRMKGWKIWRLDNEMALHDAAMTRFDQWWKRTLRAGYAYAAGAILHWGLPERYWLKELRSIFFWGLVIPLIAIIGFYFFGYWAFAILAIYLLQIFRLAIKADREIWVNFLRAFFLVLGKFPEMLGASKFLVSRMFNIKSKIIEYK